MRKNILRLIIFIAIVSIAGVWIAGCGGGSLSSESTKTGYANIQVAYPQDEDKDRGTPDTTSSSYVAYYLINVYRIQSDRETTEDREPVIPTTRINYPIRKVTILKIPVGVMEFVVEGFNEANELTYSGSAQKEIKVGDNGLLAINVYSVSKDPHISSVSPTDPKWGDKVTITGSNFGDSRGDVKASGSNVLITSKPLSDSDYISWSDTKIEFKMPRWAMSGDICVQVGEKVSNKVKFTHKRAWKGVKEIQKPFDCNVDSPPALAFNIYGEATCVYGRAELTSSSIYSSSYTPGRAGWSAPELVADSGGSAWYYHSHVMPSIADPYTMVCTYVNSGSALYANWKTKGWGSQEIVNPGMVNPEYTLGRRPDGKMVVIYVESNFQKVYYQEYGSVKAGWTTPKAISGTCKIDHRPTIAFDKNGVGYAAYLEGEDVPSSRMITRKLNPDGTLGLPKRIDDSSTSQTHPLIGIDESGNVLYVYIKGTQLYYSIWYAGSSSPTPPEIVNNDTNVNSTSDPILLMDRVRQIATLIYVRNVGSNRELCATRLNLTKKLSWGPVKVISSDVASDRYSACQSPEGDVMCVFVEPSSSTLRGIRYDYVNGKGWLPTVSISGDKVGIGYSTVKYDEAGNAMAVFYNSDGALFYNIYE